jgi:hypothetical protein
MLPTIARHAITSWMVLELLHELRKKTFSERKQSMLALLNMIDQYWYIPSTEYEKYRTKLFKKFFKLSNSELSTQAEALTHIRVLIHLSYGEHGEIKQSSDAFSDKENFLFNRLDIIMKGFEYKSSDERSI